MKAAPSLGRGLASLLPQMTDASSAKVAVLALDLLEPNPFQPRGQVQADDLTDLANSIQAQGILQPILVRPHPSKPNHYQIVAGERRWRAAKLAGLAAIPCYTRDMADAEAGAAALIENLQRQDLNPIEEADGYQRLIQTFDLTQEALAQAVGKSRSHIANTIRLLSLPDAVKSHLQTGTITAGHARAAMATGDPAATAELIVAKGLSVRQAEALSAKPVSAAKARPVEAERNSSTADLTAVEADLTEQLGLQVSIRFDGRGGTVTLRYQNLDQLDHIVARLGRSFSV